MNDKRLLRQIKKSLGTENFLEDWQSLQSHLNTQYLQSKWLNILQNIPELLASIERSYQQLDMKLEIADHSLALSSEELNLANKKVSESKKLITDLLDSLEEGFIVLDRNAICTSVYSRRAEEFFGKDLTGLSLNHILKIPSHEIDGLKEWWDYLFSGDHDFKSLVDLAPEFYRSESGDLNLKLEFKPIYEKEVLTAIILISKDITAETVAKDESLRNLARLQLVLNRYQDPENFERSLDLIQTTAQELLKGSKSVNPSEEYLGDLRRSLHTLKGAMLMISFAGMVELVHKIESEFDEKQSLGLLDQSYLAVAAKNIQDLYQELYDSESETLGLTKISSTPHRNIEIEELLKFHSQLQSAPNGKFLSENFYDKFLKTSLMDLLSPLKSHAIRQAQNQGKLIDVTIQCNAEDRVDLSLNPLFQNLIHIINNSIDHGIEPKLVREDLGKNPRGKIKISASIHDEQLFLNICDDGQGIDIDKVRAKALDYGLIDATASDNDIVMQIFSEGFSTQDDASYSSGRGMGLNSLKKWLDKNEGFVKVHTVAGQGTEFNINAKIRSTVSDSQKQSAA